jgi:hypothetical protein
MLRKKFVSAVAMLTSPSLADLDKPVATLLGEGAL